MLIPSEQGRVVFSKASLLLSSLDRNPLQPCPGLRMVSLYSTPTTQPPRRDSYVEQ